MKDLLVTLLLIKLYPARLKERVEILIPFFLPTYDFSVLDRWEGSFSLSHDAESQDFDDKTCLMRKRGSCAKNLATVSQVGIKLVVSFILLLLEKKFINPIIFVLTNCLKRKMFFYFFKFQCFSQRFYLPSQS